MLKVVNFSCGHSVEVHVPNNEEKRIKRIKELEETGLCPECTKTQYEKEDKENSKSGVCIRVHRNKLKDFPNYVERKYGYPKEKDYIYIFISPEEVCAEAIKKLMQLNNISFEEAVSRTEKVFIEKYPELHKTLVPLDLDEEISIPYPEVIETNEKPQVKPVETKANDVIEPKTQQTESNKPQEEKPQEEKPAETPKTEDVKPVSLDVPETTEKVEPQEPVKEIIPDKAPSTVPASYDPYAEDPYAEIIDVKDEPVFDDNKSIPKRDRSADDKLAEDTMDAIEEFADIMGVDAIQSLTLDDLPTEKELENNSEPQPQTNNTAQDDDPTEFDLDAFFAELE